MIADCPHKGELGLVSGLRDPGRQWDLRLARVGLANIWKSPPRGNPVTAVPARWNPATGRWEGGSKHQTGEAADFGGTQRAMEWMRANREAYGLALTVRSEGWHVEADRRDVFTGRTHNNPTVSIPPFGGQPPREESFMAALTPDEQRDLYEKVNVLHHEFTKSIPDTLDAQGRSTKAGTVRWRLTTLLNRTSDLVTGRRPER